MKRLSVSQSVSQSVCVSSAFHRRRRARRLKISHDGGRGPRCPETCNRDGPSAGRHVARAHVRHRFSMEMGEMKGSAVGPTARQRVVAATRGKRWSTEERPAWRMPGWSLLCVMHVRACAHVHDPFLHLRNGWTDCAQI